NIAMKCIRARLDRGIDDAALKIAKLCRSVVGDQVEFLDCIRGRRVTQQVIRYLVIVHAVEQEIVRLLTISVDQRTSAIPAGVVAVIETAGIGRNGARRKQRQLYGIERGEGEIGIGG